MRHRKKKKTLSRTSQKRKALIRNLANDFILQGKIKTTPAKARVLKSYLEKLITRSRINNLDRRRYLESYLNKKSAQKLITEISPRYQERKGGYLRLIKLKNRVGDNAPQVLMEFV